MAGYNVGNQLPILLIDFTWLRPSVWTCWESVTDPLDRLQRLSRVENKLLGISYRSS